MSYKQDYRNKKIRENQILKAHVKEQIGMDTMAAGKVCKHGLVKCLTCNTAKRNITEVKLEEIPF